ncbi:MAG: DUF2079 domain-containing protein [Sorangiineae bacterium]|nr:DUF2079 domain-containing protein [Polyangiaceae bacterium]MEB2322232.1 DUF2079 domain-containing protein [Sorangiineae bacterium]
MSSEGLRESEGAGPCSVVGERAGQQAAASPWGALTRSLALAAVIGTALVMCAQYSLRAGWVTDFIKKNALDLGKRMVLIESSLAGGAVAVLVAVIALALAYRRQRSFAGVERALWFLSPLALAPAFPIVFRYQPWKGRAEALLPFMLVVALATEVLVTRAFRSSPAWLSRLRAKISRVLPGLIARHGFLATVIAAAIFYAGFMSFYTLRWHYKLRTHNFDLSINNNLMYAGLEGAFMQGTVAFGDNPAEYLAAHAKYGGYLFLPLYALYPKAEFLIALQSTVLGLAAIPLFLFSRKRLPEWAAAAVALAWVLYYPTHSANFYEVKWVPIAAFFVVAAVWAIDAKLWVAGWALIIAGILMREDMPIGFAMIGLVLLLSGHRPKTGLVLAIGASIWFVVLRFYVMNQAGSWWFPGMYKGLWAPGEHGFKSVIKTVLSNPAFTFGKLIEPKKLVYLLHILVPIAFLPARRWYLWAAFIPGIIITLFTTSYDPPITYSFQYVMHWAPYVFLAAPLALSAIAKSAEHGPSRLGGAVCAMLFASSALSYNYGAFPRRNTLKGGFFSVDFGFTPEDKKRLDQLYELVALIPNGVSVAATENVGPHVSSRRYMYSMRQGPHDAEWVLASSRETKLDQTEKNLRKVIHGGEYGVFKRVGEFALFKKGYDTAGNAALGRDWHL